jgi:Skp family chaperone for outer membrane proteins
MHRELTDFKRPKPPKRKGKLYPDSAKLEAVKLWLLTGNLRHCSAALNIPYITLQSWRYSDWWKELVEELKTEENIQLNQRLRKIAEKSLEVLSDRLENGDYILDKQTGELKRKPVNLRDTTLAYNSLHDRRQKLLEQKTDKQENQQVMDRLSALAQKFEEIANRKQPIQVTDVMFVEKSDAVHDQREEGLQEGTELGTQEEAKSGEGSGGAQQGALHDGA